MSEVASAPVAVAWRSSDSSPAWNLAWLTPSRCRIILALVLLLDCVGHVRYLTHNCPIDLSGDEAQYWDWSRNLDWSYYSKGPLIAYIIRGSCAIFGDTMPGVRYPALVFAVATSIVTYLLTRKLFGSERLALGVVLLNHLVPMFVAGSVLMTIDPPMFFCWALATYFAAIAIFNDRAWAWPFCGLAVGIGFLAKYAVMLWFGGLVLFFIFDPEHRARLKSAGPWIAFLVALLMTMPVIVWNARHGWVSYRHVVHQTGAGGGSLSRGNVAEFIASQIGLIGPVLAVVMVLAVRQAFRSREPRELFLAAIGTLFFALTFLTSFFAKVQMNWPAPAYFTLMILCAHFLGTRLESRETWRRWQWWFWGTVALGLLFMPLAHDNSFIFPIVKQTKINPATVDWLDRLRGWQILGDEVTRRLRELGPGSIVLCDDYMQTAETAFYVKGQPKTYCAGSYYADAKRFTQYDMWADRRPDDPKLLGKNAVYIGKGGVVPADMAKAFERFEPLPDLPVMVRGVQVKRFKLWLGYGFKGMTRTAATAVGGKVAY